MPSLSSLRFDHSQWQAVEKKEYIEVWADDIKSLSAVLSVEYFTSAPEIAVSLDETNKVRFLYRSLANQSGAALISADVIPIYGIKCIQTVFKMPQTNRGFVYIGSLTIPFAEFSFVVKIQCLEKGFTGVRDAVVYDQVLASGAELDEHGKIKNWQQDPYDKEATFPLMPNMADSESYDSAFPQHALSRVRNTLRQVRETISFDEELKGAKRFSPE